MRKIIVSFWIAIFLSTSLIPVAESAADLRAGSRNGDVWDLQYRLHTIGYYPDRIDGIFGTKTRSAVTRFQHDYGLQPDGIVGPATWRALKRVSANADELTLLARAVYSEARGEPYVGQVAVAAVIMNRLRSADFPNTIAGVIFQPWAFTAVHDGQFWLTPNAASYQAALDALRGWDPTNGALYYFNPQTATSSWIWSRQQTGKIGRHVFAI